MIGHRNQRAVAMNLISLYSGTRATHQPNPVVGEGGSLHAAKAFEGQAPHRLFGRDAGATSPPRDRDEPTPSGRPTDAPATRPAARPRASPFHAPAPLARCPCAPSTLNDGSPAGDGRKNSAWPLRHRPWSAPNHFPEGVDTP